MTKFKDLAAAVRDQGGRALIVGGWVRDRLLGRESKDVDLEVFGLPADRLRGLLERFGKVDVVGASFQVFKVGDIDVSLPRRESKAGRGHKGFAVTGDPAMTVEEAARRRDFTINAVSWDPVSEEYIDPFGGREDLERGVLFSLLHIGRERRAQRLERRLAVGDRVQANQVRAPRAFHGLPGSDAAWFERRRQIRAE